MKKALYVAVMLFSLSAFAADPEINEKVLTAFNKTFADARNVSWTELEDQSCQANFNLSETTLRVLYDIEGNLLETVRYYEEKGLPPHILAKLKKRYPGKQVYGVTEISSETKVVYEIILNDDKNWYVVQSDPYASLVQVNKFRRGEPKN